MPSNCIFCMCHYTLEYSFFVASCLKLNITSTIPYQTTHKKRLCDDRLINTQLSILSMQIEKEVLHLTLDFRKAQWKTWYMHPFPLAIHFLWKDDSYITASQNFEANTWQCSNISLFFFLSTAEIRDPTDITEFALFPLLPVLPLLLSSEGSVWPQNTLDILCCYFQYKISIQGLLDASQCLFSFSPTQFSLNARQIERF